MTFEERLAAIAAAVAGRLESLIAERWPGEPAARLVEACRYAVLGEGKRFRPFLVAESGRLLGVPRERALMVGAALECVHAYSLVHDDLPAMDDDDLRRGRPTVHKAFDEATAILAGDALQTFAFEILALPETHPDPEVRIALVAELARATGASGMAGGQMLDLDAERRPFGLAEVERLQAMKTGALIRFACRAGGLLGGADATRLAALTAYGEAVGLAFQISDDLLDAEGEAAVVGKATAKDASAGKATLVGLLGPFGARQRLQIAEARAIAALQPFGAKGAVLAEAARFQARRRK